MNILKHISYNVYGKYLTLYLTASTATDNNMFSCHGFYACYRAKKKNCDQFCAHGVLTSNKSTVYICVEG